MQRPRNVFVLGLDEHNRRVLEAMPGADRYRFHGVLTYRDIFADEISFASVLASAQERLHAFRGPIDAIVGFWDFPVTAVVQVLRARYGLPGTRMAELVMCEHKYWSRRVQQQVIEEYPPFGVVDPEKDVHPPTGLRYPMWVKPVKSFSSVLAFGVDGPESFRRALGEIAAGIGRIGEPFDALLEHVELPADVASVGGQACMVEEAIIGRQVTVEGYRYRGSVVLYGVVDSINYDNSPSFLRFQYPSSLPGEVRERLADISQRVVRAIGLEASTFNIEYFWDPGTDAITLLEINPRHSQSHARLFADVDGLPNHAVMLDLAFGRKPDFPSRAGRYDVAAKWFIRRFTDGVVRTHPSTEEIAAFERDVPGAAIVLKAHAGDRLSQMRGQDSYSYQLASVYLGAADEAELTAKFEQISAALRYDIDDVVEPTGVC